MTPISDHGRTKAHNILDGLSWRATIEGFDLGAVDRAIARFLAELDEPACVRCGGEPRSVGGTYCDPCRKAAGRERRKAKA